MGLQLEKVLQLFFQIFVKQTMIFIYLLFFYF